MKVLELLAASSPTPPIGRLWPKDIFRNAPWGYNSILNDANPLESYPLRISPPVKLLYTVLL